MNLTCTTTADVLKDGFIPGAGQNKKLMKLALDSKTGKVFEPLKIQGGYGVYKLIDKTPAGYRNFDSIKTTMVKPKVVEKKKFAVLKQMATDLRAKIQNNDIKTLSTLTPPSIVETADSVSVSKPAAKIGQDYAVTDAIFSMKQGEISQPVKGTRGYYLIQLNTVTPFNQEDYLKAYNDIRNSLLMQKKQSVVQEWLQKMQNEADIIDNRDRFFN
jgi:parvulin-like peptidyl-prolyl isomerase